MNLGVWRRRKVAVVKMRMTARLCSLLSLCCTVSCLLKTLPWPPPLAFAAPLRLKIVQENWKGWPQFDTDPCLCRSRDLSRLMVLYIWRLSTERIVNGTITEKLTPGHTKTGQWQYLRKLTCHYHPEPWRIKHDVMLILSQFCSHGVHSNTCRGY